MESYSTIELIFIRKFPDAHRDYPILHKLKLLLYPLPAHYFYYSVSFRRPWLLRWLLRSASDFIVIKCIWHKLDPWLGWLDLHARQFHVPLCASSVQVVICKQHRHCRQDDESGWQNWLLVVMILQMVYSGQHHVRTYTHEFPRLLVGLIRVWLRNLSSKMLHPSRMKDPDYSI